ncbi:MAG: hypothetical protein A3C83_01745 [Candidatus Ryanbacteria bacterium RIFCSPHIGHO2_02_FULL_47_25]|nr:MAG: hypothetical protein A3C83_01745 [Candidatus Ryanbacteria bacterium RIFCSPHIGHO2_02_FULL_47_25]
MAFALFFDSLAWIWRDGVREYARGWMNVHWFVYHFFSMPVLFESFFAPFHRLRERARAGFDIEDWLGVIVINVLMRIVGMIVRTAFLALGILAECVVFLLGSFFFLVLVSGAVFVPIVFVIGVITLFL